MKDNNARAPQKRSGDAINPVLGGIIKITAIVVIAALIVLITIVTVKLIQESRKIPDLFEDSRVVLTKEEFATVIDPKTNVEDITNKKILDVIDEIRENENIVYFYFYYSDLRKTLEKKNKGAELKLVNSLNKSAPIFMVDLFEEVTEESTGQTNLALLRSDSRLTHKDIEIATILDAKVKDKKGNLIIRYQTFILSLDFENKGGISPFERFYGEPEGKDVVFELLTALKEDY